MSHQDMIKVQGYQVSPTEIEEEIRQLTGVAEVAVVSRTSKPTGDKLYTLHTYNEKLPKNTSSSMFCVAPPILIMILLGWSARPKDR